MGSGQHGIRPIICIRRLFMTSLLHNQGQRRCLNISSSRYTDTCKTDKNSVQNQFKYVMRNVPQPVVVVTTAHRDHASNSQKRGITCSSFTSVSMKPPILSFAMNLPSRMHDLLQETGHFAVHVLAQNQVDYALHFSKPAKEGSDQFAAIELDIDSKQGLPILRDTCAVLQCKTYDVNVVGDHSVWYGEVLHSYHNDISQQPLLHYSRGFRSVGDEMFVHAFESQALPFAEWTHEAHLRMAWYYIRDMGRDNAVPAIKDGIKKYNEENKEKISRGYHETVTMFYIHMVAVAIAKCDHPDMTFEEFIGQNNYLTDKTLLFQYYTDEIINKKDAYTRYILPDKKEIHQ